MGRPNLGRRQALRRQRRGDPVDEELTKRDIVDMLELAAAAFGEMTAGRHRPMGARYGLAVVGDDVARCRHRHEAAAFGHAVAATGEADDGFAVHRQSATAAGRQATRSSAISAGPASSAARLWSQTPAHAAS